LPAVVVEVVPTNSAEVTGLVPVTAVLAIEHVGAFVPDAAGVTAQLSATAPVNPPEGVTAIVAVPLLPCATVIGPLFASVNVAAPPFVIDTVAYDGA
jgi:hypothetical protein